MKRKSIFWFFVIVFLAFLLFSYHLPSSYGFDNDFARDLIEIQKIVQGKITLLGPKSSFGGLYTGPFYYYLFVPVFFIFKHSLEAVLYFNALLFALAIGYFFSKTAKHFGLVKAMTASLCLLLLPLILTSSRSPGNAYTYLALLLAMLVYVFFERPKSWKQMIVLGFCGGIIINFHYGTFIVILTLGLFLFLTAKKKQQILGYFFGIFLSFLPLLFFEVKHHFVMLKNTFLKKSYLTFSSGNYAETKNAGFFSRIEGILTEIKKVILLHPLICILIAYLAVWKKRLKREKTFFFLAGLDLLIILLIFRFQFVSFYFYSFALFIFFASLMLLLKSKWWWILLTFLAVEIIFFPRSLYQNSSRNWKEFSAAADYLINNKILDKKNQFSVLQIRKDTALAPYGYEYGFFLREKGYLPNAEDSYRNSDQLLVINEQPVDLMKLENWEAKEFGLKNLAAPKIYRFNNLYIYKNNKVQ